MQWKIFSFDRNIGSREGFKVAGFFVFSHIRMMGLFRSARLGYVRVNLFSRNRRKSTVKIWKIRHFEIFPWSEIFYLFCIYRVIHRFFFFWNSFYSLKIWAIFIKLKVFVSLLLTILWDINEKSAKLTEKNLQDDE